MKKLLIALFCTFVVLSLEAGEEIVLKAGTHIKAGADVHLKINYEPCPNYPRPCAFQGMAQNNSFNEASANHISENDDVDDLSVSSDKRLENTVKVFPNPTTNSFIIETSDNTTIQSIIVYNISGQLVVRKIGSIIDKLKEHLPNKHHLTKFFLEVFVGTAISVFYFFAS